MFVNYLFGYSKSGKSTFLDKQEKVVSTSDFIYDCAIYYNRQDILNARRIKDDPTSDPEAALNARKAIIRYVENDLIKGLYGSRDAFIQAAFTFYAEELELYHSVWVVCLNMDEFEKVQKCINKEIPDVKHVYYNIHRSSELIGVDARELHPNPDYVITAS